MQSSKEVSNTINLQKTWIQYDPPLIPMNKNKNGRIYCRMAVIQIAISECKSNLTRNFQLNWYSKINRVSSRKYPSVEGHSSQLQIAEGRESISRVSWERSSPRAVEIAALRWSSRPYIFPWLDMDIHSRMYINYWTLWPGRKATRPYFTADRLECTPKHLTYLELMVENTFWGRTL